MLLVVFTIVWILPQWLIQTNGLLVKERLELEDKARATLVQLLDGSVIGLGAI